jgi:acyl-CoA synthetase (NDP forming)
MVHEDMMESARALKRILTPKSIAIVGASSSFANPGTNLMASVMAGGYEGKIYPIHPREKVALGLTVYPKLTDVPDEIDLAIIVVSNKVVPEIFYQCKEKGITSAVVITAGYKEMGEEGAKLERELLALARKYGIRFVGPNVIGIINAHIKLNASMFVYEGGSGGVGLVSQSGSYVTQPLPYFPKLGINLSSAVSIGNQTDIDLSDALAYFSIDDTTRAVATYIEGVGDGRKFMEAVSLLTAKKPLVALYVGGTEVGSRAGKSHTGAVASPDAIIDAVFHQTGVVRAHTVAELYDFAHAFATQPLPKGDRVAVVTHSGGPGVSMADAAVRLGLKVPVFSEGLQKMLREKVIHTAQVGNPVDITMDFDIKKLFIDVTAAVIESGEVDAILFYGVFGSTHLMKKFQKLGISDTESLAQYDSFLDSVIHEFSEMNRKANIPIISASFAGNEDKAVATVMEMDIPIYPTPERASAALGALVRYARYRKIFR